MSKHEEMRVEVLKRYSEQDPFYVWFEAMEEGRKSEQERIIEILTRQAYASRTLGCRDEADTLDFAISLIKAGEND
jgi:hypothetical protein